MNKTKAFQDSYTVRSLVGRGGQGQVYCVEEKETGAIYAAKRIPLTNWDEVSRLETEVKALQGLNNKHIPQFREMFVDESTWKTPEFILVTDFVNGQDFSVRLEKGERFSEEQLKNFRAQTLEALTEAHSKGIVHRDIKPSNLILEDNGSVNVTDFGLAKFLGQETQKSSLGKGSVFYMAPEQIKGGKITPETDYYQLGLTLIALASGVERNDDYRHDEPKKQIAKLTHLSEGFRKSLDYLVSEDLMSRRKGLDERGEIVVVGNKEIKAVEDNGFFAHPRSALGKWGYAIFLGGGGVNLISHITQYLKFHDHIPLFSENSNRDFAAFRLGVGGVILAGLGMMVADYLKNRPKKIVGSKNILDSKVTTIKDDDLLLFNCRYSEVYDNVVPGTIQCADQLMNKCRINKQFLVNGLGTADGLVYSVDKGIPTLRITREKTNPIFLHLNDTRNNPYKDLLHYQPEDNYPVFSTDFDIVKEASDTVTINLTKLNLRGGHNYVTIPTFTPYLFERSYNALNSEQRKLAERFYGQGEDFIKNMKMLNDRGILYTRISVLTPAYVKNHATENAIGNVLRFRRFDSSFSCDSWGHITGPFLCVGVKKEGNKPLFEHYSP